MLFCVIFYHKSGFIVLTESIHDRIANFFVNRYQLPFCVDKKGRNFLGCFSDVDLQISIRREQD